MQNEAVTVVVTFKVDPKSVHRRAGNVSTASLVSSFSDVLDELFQVTVDDLGRFDNCELIGDYIIDVVKGQGNEA